MLHSEAWPSFGIWSTLSTPLPHQEACWGPSTRGRKAERCDCGRSKRMALSSFMAPPSLVSSTHPPTLILPPTCSHIVVGSTRRPIPAPALWSIGRSRIILQVYSVDTLCWLTTERTTYTQLLNPPPPGAFINPKTTKQGLQDETLAVAQLVHVCGTI